MHVWKYGLKLLWLNRSCLGTWWARLCKMPRGQLSVRPSHCALPTSTWRFIPCVCGGQFFEVKHANLTFVLTSKSYIVPYFLNGKMTYTPRPQWSVWVLLAALWMGRSWVRCQALLNAQTPSTKILCALSRSYVYYCINQTDDGPSYLVLFHKVQSKCLWHALPWQVNWSCLVDAMPFLWLLWLLRVHVLSQCCHPCQTRGGFLFHAVFYTKFHMIKAQLGTGEWSFSWNKDVPKWHIFFPNK